MRLLTKAQEKSLSKHWDRTHHKHDLGLLTQQEERTMNDNLNNPTFQPVPAEGDNTNTDKTWGTRMSEEDFRKLLEVKVATADGKPLDGEIVGYLTDTDEASDEPTPTIH